ncbi:MAG: HAMP domain-containing histidine kinase [Bradymonadales bacterium]|nr:HAMP domain-containing histidine kinase [Bradymonadales bacterium]
MRVGLRAQIGLVLTVIMVVTVALMGASAVNLMRRAVYDQLAAAGERMAGVVAQELSEALEGHSTNSSWHQVEGLSSLGQSFVARGIADRIEVRRVDGSLAAIFAEKRSGASGSGGWSRSVDWNLEGDAPVQWVDLPGYPSVLVVRVGLSVDGELAGTVLAAFAHRDLAARLRTVQLLSVAYLVLDGLLLLIVGYVLLTRIIVSPVRRIALATERVGAGDYASHVELASRNELGDLARSFNRMVDRLDRSRRELQEQVFAHKEAKQQLERAQAAIIRGEKLASVGRLAAGIAHEVGNPLSALLGFVEILQQDPKMHLESRKEILARLEQELLRIHEIIRGLLDYSRDRGDEPADCDVELVTDQAINLVKNQPRFRDIEIKIGVAIDLPHVRVNPDRLLQVLINLLLNAADAVDGKGWVRVTAATENDGVRIGVEDSGPGILPELIDRIFDPFFTTKPPGQGTGLGLAICERIVQSAGGRLEVEGKTEHGARFTVWFARTDPGDQERG